MENIMIKVNDRPVLLVATPIAAEVAGAYALANQAALVTTELRECPAGLALDFLPAFAKAIVAGMRCNRRPRRHRRAA
ncbi:MAG: hypothetical protein E7199_03655 [Schwartzia succinivorans]|nr:hypothetical protein [Schwartzia succinivorans]